MCACVRPKMAQWRDESDFDWDPRESDQEGDVAPSQQEYDIAQPQSAAQLLSAMRDELLRGNATIRHCIDTVDVIRAAPNVGEALDELHGEELQKATRLAAAVGSNAYEHFLPVLQQLDALLISIYEKEQQLVYLMTRK